MRLRIKRRSASIWVSPGTAEKAEAAALALEVGPAAHQPPGLVVEMGQLDLEPAFRRRRAFAEDFEDQAGAVDDLGLGHFLQGLLLDRRERRVDHQQPGLVLFEHLSHLLGLAGADQRRRTRGADLERLAGDDVDADRRGQPLGLVEPRFERAHRRGSGDVGQQDHRPFAAADPFVVAAVEDAQLISPCSALAPPRSSGPIGWRVEMACL